MKWLFCLLLFSVLFWKSACSQNSRDSSFSILVNSGVSFTRANDLHINKWLKEYGYPTEPHTPASFNMELSAIPESSRMMYSVRMSIVTSAKNLSSYNLGGGVYYSFVNKKEFILMAGLGVGYHNDIITLNGKLPPDYLILANRYNRQLSLRRDGLFLDPAVRAFWFPVNLHNVQVGLYANLGYDMDFNSKWKLGYYDNKHGKSNHFKKITNPADQQKVNEYGIAYAIGLSVRIHIL